VKLFDSWIFVGVYKFKRRPADELIGLETCGSKLFSMAETEGNDK